jgi:hypothetical protein
MSSIEPQYYLLSNTNVIDGKGERVCTAAHRHPTTLSNGHGGQIPECQRRMAGLPRKKNMKPRNDWFLSVMVLVKVNGFDRVGLVFNQGSSWRSSA